MAFQDSRLAVLHNRLLELEEFVVALFRQTRLENHSLRQLHESFHEAQVEDSRLLYSWRILSSNNMNKQPFQFHSLIPGAGIPTWRKPGPTSGNAIVAILGNVPPRWGAHDKRIQHRETRWMRHPTLLEGGPGWPGDALFLGWSSEHFPFQIKLKNSLFLKFIFK